MRHPKPAKVGKRPAAAAGGQPGVTNTGVTDTSSSSRPPTTRDGTWFPNVSTARAAGSVPANRPLVERGGYPHLAAWLRAPSAPSDEAFELGLDWLLDGLARALGGSS